MAGRVLHLWNEWSIQILILLSFTLQVFILLFARMRRRNSRAWRLLLWLAYLLADTTALYTLGHISNSNLPELRPAAFWAQFLLLHLGGQDTMTAYALEDNQLWLRHLLTLVLQALGAAYMFYRHIADEGTLLVMAAVLIYLVGFMKYGERVWALKSSSHDGITKFLDNVKLDQSAAAAAAESPFRSREGPPLPQSEEEDPAAKDVVLDAHELLYICMGQFVDYKVWPSVYQSKVISKYCSVGGLALLELIGMQLSLMHDIFYTKAVVIHTWYGICSRVASLVATATSLLLFRLKTVKDGYTRRDVAFTYTLLVGAIALEMTSLLRAVWSSRTCATIIDKMKTRTSTLRSSLSCPAGMLYRCREVLSRCKGMLYRCINNTENGSYWLYRAEQLFFRRQLWLGGQGLMKWPSSVGQHNLLDLFTMRQDRMSLIARITGLEKWLNKLRITDTVNIFGHRLMLKEIERIVIACNGNEDRMWSYRGQCALRGWERYSEDPTGWCMDIDFDESILAWHFATNLFLLGYKEHPAAAAASGAGSSPSSYLDILETINRRDLEEKRRDLEAAIKVLSNYMMFLLVEHPYMLPSPVRARRYDLSYTWLLALSSVTRVQQESSSLPVLSARDDLMKLVVDRVQAEQSGSPAVLVRGATLATILLSNAYSPQIHQVIFGVWVEMLCYAASHCSRDSHARQLNSGAELITAVWIAQTTMFNHINGEAAWFRRATDDFFQSRSP